MVAAVEALNTEIKEKNKTAEKARYFLHLLAQSSLFPRDQDTETGQHALGCRLSAILNRSQIHIVAEEQSTPKSCQFGAQKRIPQLNGTRTGCFGCSVFHSILTRTLHT